MAVTDSLTGKQVARVVIGRGPDGAVFDADLGLVFSSNGLDGTLTVIHEETPDEYRVAATVTTQVSARTMVIDPATHKNLPGGRETGSGAATDRGGAATASQRRPR